MNQNNNKLACIGGGVKLVGRGGGDSPEVIERKSRKNNYKINRCSTNEEKRKTAKRIKGSKIYGVEVANIMSRS